MKKMVAGLLLLMIGGLARAQSVQYGPYAFTATAATTIAEPVYGAQVDTLGITVTGLSTTTSWTVQIQTSPNNTTWSNCGTAVSVAANATVTATCTPQGGAYVHIVVTAGTGGGSLRGSIFGLNTKIGALGSTAVAYGSTPLATASIASGTCQVISAGSVNSSMASGAVVGDQIIWTPGVSLQTVAGYKVSTSGALSIDDYITAGYVNFNVCNWTVSSITPGALTLYWSVVV